MTGVDWAAETVLDAAITAAGLPPVRDGEPNTVLLTGATGFLGAFLLDEILRETKATVVCLARAGNDAEAGDRIRDNLRRYGLDPSGQIGRVVPLAGDLARPRFGLAADRWDRLASDVDAVVHNGAQVHFLHPYAAFRAANVAGTQEVLRLATTARLKPVHFVSSLAVLAGAGTGRAVGETDRDDAPDGLENGYAQSKWAAEELVWRAIARGVPATVLRPGRVGWHSRTGALSTDDLVCRAIRACVQLGAAPALDTRLEMSPVDFVSRAIVAIARRRDSVGRAYHLSNHRPVGLRQLLDWVRAAGYPLTPLPPERWLRTVQQSADATAGDALTALLPLVAGNPGLAGEPALADPQIDDRNTLAALAGTGIECPPVTAESVAAFLARLVTAGLLPPPESPKPLTNSRHANGHANGHHPARPRVQGTK
jgi:myxalamid-type nonribosomal peptide synthetase MxaA